MSMYKFESPITVNYGDDCSWKSSTEPLTSAKEYARVITSTVDDDMRELGPTGLAQYLDYNYRKLEDGIVNSIIVKVENYKAVTYVESTRDLTEEELDKVKDYISGQFSDGWGEGFEQSELDSYESTENEECWDEEEQEIYYEPVTYKTTISASFWDHKDWNISLA